MHRFVVFGAVAAFAFVGVSCKSSAKAEASTAAAPSSSGAGISPGSQYSSSGGMGSGLAASMGPRSRRLEITYEAKVAEVPAGTKELKLWIPKPRQEGAVQQVLKASLQAPPGATVVDGTDSAGETSFWAVTVPSPVAPVVCTATLDVVRMEQKNNDFRNAGKAELSPAQREEVARWLRADRKVPIDGEPAQLASVVAKDEPNRLNVARSLYDAVLARMRYSKDGTGWGQGDTLWACGSGFGNCTDFHSMFMSFGRSRGIPVRFFMGLPVPEKRGEGAIGGYHCWAEFYVAELGWVPVDISEADKYPELVQYYFGNLTEDRVSFTMGRDLQLNPSPASGVQNFFIYPIAEADGKTVKADKAFKYRDL
jgi:transglutaminase-like putative cysteine protease